MPQLPKTLPFGTSLARQVARQNLTRFNNVFWVGERARTHLKTGFSSIRFPASGPGVHGVFNTAPEWESAADEFRDWTRQHVLLSAASLLEVYVKSITTTALQANPGLLDRSLIGANGYAFILGKATPPEGWKKSVEAAASSFMASLWKHRIRRLEIVFGKLSVKLIALEPELQKIQNKRNRIAHQFGVDLHRSTPWDAVNHVVVGPRDCENAIKAVSAFIAEADSNVFGELVGAHEILELYHDWSHKEPNPGRYRVTGTRAAVFCDYIGQLSGKGIGKEYTQAIIDYYDML